jgi:hypothetical protein
LASALDQSVACSVALVRCMCGAAAISSGHAICSSSLPEPCLSLAFAHIETCTPACTHRSQAKVACTTRNLGDMAVALANESRTPSPWPDMVGSDHVNGAAAGVTLGCAHSHIGTHWPAPTRSSVTTTCTHHAYSFTQATCSCMAFALHEWSGSWQVEPFAVLDLGQHFHRIVPR